MNIDLTSSVGGAVITPQPTAVAIGEWVTAFSQSYRRELDELEATLWVKLLGQFSPRIIEAAFSDWLRTQDKFPTIAAMVARIDMLQFGGLEMRWTHAYQAARSANGHVCHFIVFDDPRTHFAIEALGGWGTFQDRVIDAKGLSFAHHDFDYACREYRPGNSYVAGFGHFNGQNVVLIGDANRARDVYAASQRFADKGVIPGLGLLGSVHALPYGQLALPSILLTEHLFVAPPSDSNGPWSWNKVDNDGGNNA